MKKSIALVIAVIALLVVALPIVNAQAATPEATTPNAIAALTFTEAEINHAYWVTNPVNRHLSNVHLDLQAANGGQITITARYTWVAAHRVVKSAHIVVVVTPRVSAGRLYWDVISITADGQPASADVVSEVNARLADAWRNWVREQLPTGHITAVTITDDTITFTYTPHLI